MLDNHRFCKFSHCKLITFFCLIFLLAACGSETTVKTKSSETEQQQSYSLSGSIIIEPDTGVDDDVEQQFSDFISFNGTLDDAQIIANPVRLGGYLSGRQGEYLSANSEGISYAQDLNDYFRVSLIEDQAVNLNLFHAENDVAHQGVINVSLSLMLVDFPEDVVAALVVENTGEIEVVSPETGEYYIQLSALENTSVPLLYTLSLSHPLEGNALYSGISINSNFVEDELIVKFKEPVGVESSLQNNRSFRSVRQAKVSNFEQANQLKLDRKVGLEAYVFKVDAEAEAEVEAESKGFSFEQEFSQRTLSIKQRAKWRLLQAISDIEADKDVLYAEPNYIRYATSIPPNDPEYPRQWSLPMISLPGAWQVSTGENVTIAVIDTGINLNHEDLVQNISDQGFDFISNVASAGDGDGADADPSDLGSSFHGSHVAGIIASRGNNNLGISGIAYEASIMPLRVLGVNDLGDDSNIANAILYAAGLTNSSGQLPSARADIINLSLGGPDISITLRNAVEQAIEQGVVVIAAAGNESTSDEFYPAAYDDVVGVSSVNEEKQRSSFSNFGDYVDVTAPGGTGFSGELFDGFQDGILSTLQDNEYGELKGTSMAAPHVAGVAALMKSVNGSLDHTSFLLALNSGLLTDELPETSLNNFFGNGLINAAKAVSWAYDPDEESIPTTLVFYPNSFSFLGANTDSLLTITNAGAGSIDVSNLSASDDWIDFRPENIDSFGLGTYHVGIDSSAIVFNTVKVGTISFDFQENDNPVETQTLKVFVSKTLPGDDSVGLIHIYLEKPGGDGIYTSIGGVLNQGVYSYQFNDIPEGEYYIKASTDNDGDGEVSDKGEAVGQYPVIANPRLIQVEANMTGLDFEVAYPSN